MSRYLIILIVILITGGCSDYSKSPKRTPVAKAGDVYLYLDQIPGIVPERTSATDSVEIVQNYINNWAKRELLFQKAEENLAPGLNGEIEQQLKEARTNLTIYEYQQQMMFERMDTTLGDQELENYYSSNQGSFILGTNIVKALFIKVPVETPDIDRIRLLAHSNEQADLLQLETYCYQFADKFDDFNENWVPLNRISVELPEDITNEEGFLKRTTFFEAHDSTFLYLIAFRDYRLRSSLAPFEYVKDDIKRIIWNNRRLEFLQSLENGIYNDAIKEDRFKVFNN